MVSIRSAATTAGAIITVVKSVNELVRQHGGDQRMSDALATLGRRVGTWRPITSADERIARQVAAISDYAASYQTSHPADPTADSWKQRASAIDARRLAVRALPAKQRRATVKGLSRAAESLLLEALEHTVDSVDPTHTQPRPRLDG